MYFLTFNTTSDLTICCNILLPNLMSRCLMHSHGDSSCYELAVAAPAAVLQASFSSLVTVCAKGTRLRRLRRVRLGHLEQMEERRDTEKCDNQGRRTRLD